MCKIAMSKSAVRFFVDDLLTIAKAHSNTLQLPGSCNSQMDWRCLTHYV